LEQINSKLLVAKHVFPQFWRLQEDIRNFFLDNADRAQRRGNWLMVAIDIARNGEGFRAI